MDANTKKSERGDNMKKRSRLIAILLTGALAASLAACGNSGVDKESEDSSGDKVTLNVLFNDTDENVEAEMDYVMDHISEVLPDVEVKLEMVAGDAESYETKVRTMISAGGEGIDVWWERGGSWAVPILESGSALALDDYLEESGYWDKVIASTKNAKADDGHIYGLPFEDISYEIVLYNKGLFEAYGVEVPKTVSELYEVIGKFVDTDIVPISVGAKDGWPAAMMVEGFAYSVDPECTSKIVSGEATFTDEAYTQAAGVVKKLMDQGAFSANVALTGIDEALPLFESGKAAMMVNGSWAIASCAEKMGDDFGYFYFPVINDADIDSYGKNVAGGVKQNSGFMVYAGTEHPDEAAALCEAMAELRCKYVYETKGNPFTVYDVEKMEWSYDGEFAAPVIQLTEDMKGFEHTYGLVQDVMPTAAASSGIQDATSKFMTNDDSYTVENYLSDMDKAAKEK